MECPEQPPDNKLQKMPHTELGSSRGGKWERTQLPPDNKLQKMPRTEPGSSRGGKWECPQEESGVPTVTP